MASVVVGWKVCPRQFVFPQQCLLRLKRTVCDVGLSNIKCQNLTFDIRQTYTTDRAL